ncbi:MAG: ATP-binding protein [Chloroflexota bacterium]
MREHFAAGFSAVVGGMDPVALLIQAVFYLLFGVALWRYVRHPAAVERGVVAVFSTTAALFLISFISTFSPGLADIVRPLSITLLLAQPYLIVRLLGQIWTVPAWYQRAAFLAFVLSTVAVLVLGSRNTLAIVGVIAYFGITELLAARQFLRIAREREGAHQLRLNLAGMATAMFGAAIVLGAAGSAAGGAAGSPASVQVVSRLIALVAALGYLAAFLPPRWLAGYFHRAAAFDVARQAVSLPAGQGAAALWRQLADASESILGTSRIRILDGSGRPIEIGRSGPESAATEPAEPSGSEIRVPLVVDGREQATLIARLEGQPLFVEDDIAVIALLGSLTARSAQHEDDLSRLRATERALEESAAVRASEARFRVLLEADPNAVVATDDAGTIIWATRSSVDLFGYPEHELLGSRLADLIDLAGAEPESPAPESPDVRRIETTARRADGSGLAVDVALRQVDLEGRQTTVAVVADASWREEASQIRDRFVGVLSHELRTPITSIYGGAQLLLKRGADLELAVRNELLEGIADESERLQRTIENLLILDRVERGADFFGPRPVLIHRVLSDVVAHERALWPSIAFELDTPADLPVVTGDEDLLSQVLRNLLSNAVKYAGDHARITVRALYEESLVRISVADDGPGFPPDEAARLFSLYYRSSGSTAAEGAGIGLYVSRNIVEAMGGTITARSWPEGGAEFAFTLAPYVDLEDLVTTTSADGLGAPAADGGLAAAAF